MNTPTSSQDLDAARLLLARLGVAPADLLSDDGTDDAAPARQPIPTLRDWIPVVADLVSPSTAASYGSYWNKAEARRGDRRMDTITASEIKAMAKTVRRTALLRRNSRGGRNAAENSSPRCQARPIARPPSTSSASLTTFLSETLPAGRAVRLSRLPTTRDGLLR